MLNIQTRISLTKSSKRRINKFWKRNEGDLDANSWKAAHRSIKNEISYKLLWNQYFKCVYCERFLIGLAPQIDHFAHKALYPKFTFNPTNLFYACSMCNSTSRKGQKPVIEILNDRYRDCQFLIIHPYFDNPDDEIIYKDDERVDFDWDNCTQLGKDTISFFGFDDYIMTNIRSRQLIFERLNPLTSDEEFLLIQASIAYRE